MYRIHCIIWIQYNTLMIPIWLLFKIPRTKRCRKTYWVKIFSFWAKIHLDESLWVLEKDFQFSRIFHQVCFQFGKKLNNKEATHKIFCLSFTCLSNYFTVNISSNIRSIFRQLFDCSGSYSVAKWLIFDRYFCELSIIEEFIWFYLQKKWMKFPSKVHWPITNMILILRAEFLIV